MINLFFERLGVIIWALVVAMYSSNMLTIISMPISKDPSNSLGIFLLTTTFLVLVTMLFYGFWYKKKIMNPLFWKVFLFLNSILFLSAGLFREDTTFVIFGLGVFDATLILLVNYLYVFKCPQIWHFGD